MTEPTELERLACIMLSHLKPGYYNLSFAVRVHDDHGVEVVGLGEPKELPIDEVTALRAGEVGLGDGCSDRANSC